MQLNQRQRQILLGVLQDQQRLAGLPWGDQNSMPRDELGRHRLRVRHARNGLVPMDLEAWLGHAPSNSDRVLCHRAAVQLGGMGLLERHNMHGGGRTSHLRLTPAGRRVAEGLLAEEYGLDGADADVDWSKVEFLPIELPPETPAETQEPGL